MTEPVPHWPGRLVSIDDHKVFVRSAPSPDNAEPALLVHGLEGSSRNWTDLIDLLRSRHTAEASTHLLGGVVLETAGDAVSARSTVVAYLVRGGSVRVRGLRYQDRLVRDAGEWLIAERVHSLSWMSEVPVVA